MPWNQTSPMDQRTQFIADYLRGRLSMTELCDSYGVSRKTGYKWLDRRLGRQQRRCQNHNDGKDEEAPGPASGASGRRRHQLPKFLRALSPRRVRRCEKICTTALVLSRTSFKSYTGRSLRLRTPVVPTELCFRSRTATAYRVRWLPTWSIMTSSRHTGTRAS